jgi:acetyl-CoA acyltransferase
VLKQAGIRQDEVDWIELNEAFAAQALAVIRTSSSIRPR